MQLQRNFIKLIKKTTQIFYKIYKHNFYLTKNDDIGTITLASRAVYYVCVSFVYIFHFLTFSLCDVFLFSLVFTLTFRLF